MNETQYLGELAQKLRWQRLPESTVLETLSHVQDSARASQQAPETIFGAPTAYADSFPPGKAWSLGLVVTSVLIGFAVLAVAARVVWSLVLRNPTNPFVSLALYGGAVVWCFLAVTLGARLDRKLPGKIADNVGH